MTKRENLLRALRRDHPAYVPIDFDLCPSLNEEFKKCTGASDFREYYDFPYRFVEIGPTRHPGDYSRYYTHIKEELAPITWNPEWGVMGISGSLAHFQKMLHPMESFTSIQEILDYPFPDFDADYRWEGVKEQNRRIMDAGYATVAFMQMTIFELAWYLRGMEQFMADFYEDPEFNEALLDRLTELRIQMARRYAATDTDILMLGDDVSTQIDMMMSPALYREQLKPRLAKIIHAAKEVKPDILIFYHGDGNLEQIVPDLIDAGVDVLNPIQPECVDPFRLKELYGDRLSFWGGIGTQTIMPFGTSEEIYQTCKDLIQKVGKGGGLVLAPTHVLEPEVPYENLEAFLKAAHTYGRYAAPVAL